MKLEEALRAAEAQGVDLVEIAPSANPPVVKLISFDKFRYQQEKQEKKERQAQKTKELKHVRITYRAAQNDLEIRAKQTEQFLKDGHKVEIYLHLRGREKANKAWGFERLEKFLNMIRAPHEITMPPKQGGRGGYVMQIMLKK
jgi:translation initiation factor IF-3